MEKTGLILAIFLAVFLCLSVSVVYAQPEHSESYCQVSNLDLNAQGDHLEIEPGGAIEISLDYEVWNRIGCPGCIRQIVIGLNREPLCCAYHGIPGIHPGKKGQSRFTITAPTEPGTYVVRWMCASMYTCNDAEDKYRESDYLGYTIGTIKVTDNGHTESYCEVSRIDLNGQGNYLEVKPGETIRMDATYKISDSSECPGCVRQIVIGLDNGVPLYCAFNGIPGAHSGIQDGVCDVTAPTEIGTYNIMWMCTLEDTCHNAKAKYTLSPSLWKKTGTIKVIDDLGICCKVSNVNLNNQGNYLEVKTDVTFSIALDYQIWCWVEGNTRRQIMVGLDDEPFWCVYDGTPPEHPGISLHGLTLTEIQKPGTYNLMWMVTFCDNVNEAMDVYRSRPDLREKIGTIKVTGYEEWNSIHYKVVKFPDKDNVPETNISFWQKGNLLRVQIDDFDHWDINSGYVSISVDESIDINYTSAKVYSKFQSPLREFYKEINPTIGKDEKTLLFLMGLLVPHLGGGYGVAQYAQEMTDPIPHNWHVSEDRVPGCNLYSEEYFDTNDMLNSHDVVRIPWYTSSATSIRIECPYFDFPVAGTYNIIFCVDYCVDPPGVVGDFLGNLKIRYDVALPITVT